MVKGLLHKLHDKLGDFWWYSLMIFCAQRAADVMNVFVGLYLVPKYVGPQELGAVMPLTAYANFFVLPIGIIATVFRNEVSTLAINGEFGKLKTLMRGVFLSTGAFFFLALGISYFILPHFLERIRVARGSLGFVVLAMAFICAVNPIFTNTLQALKKFKATSVIGIIGAPIRLLTMLVTMPLRALTGYFVGQSAAPTFSIFATLFALRKELAVKAEPYFYRAVLLRISKFTVFISINWITVCIASLVESTVLRQRLPEIHSAAYYMATRFSEISGFLSTTLLFTMFPFTAELAVKGQPTRPYVLKSSGAMLAFSAALAIFFWLFGKPILAYLPNGSDYAEYFWAIPWMIGITALSTIASFHTSTEVSANRYRFLWWQAPVSMLYAATLLFISGIGYFKAYLPPAAYDFFTLHNICSLRAMLWCMTFLQSARVICSCIELYFQRPKR